MALEPILTTILALFANTLIDYVSPNQKISPAGG
jgi:hypothetical protein